MLSLPQIADFYLKLCTITIYHLQSSRGILSINP